MKDAEGNNSHAAIDRILAEAGLPADSDLQWALREMRGLSVSKPPTPTGELAKLLGSGPDDLHNRRWARRHRAGLMTLGVLVALTLGAGTAAAVPPIRDFATTIINRFTPFRVSPPPAPVPKPTSTRQPAGSPSRGTPSATPVAPLRAQPEDHSVGTNSNGVSRNSPEPAVANPSDSVAPAPEPTTDQSSQPAPDATPGAPSQPSIVDGGAKQ